MGLVVVMLVIVVGAGWIVWRRKRHNRRARTVRVSPQGRSNANGAHKAFVHGNTCLMEGKLDEASAAFHQAREIEPNHPHIAGRLAEVERQQQASSAVAPAKATC